MVQIFQSCNYCIEPNLSNIQLNGMDGLDGWIGWIGWIGWMGGTQAVLPGVTVPPAAGWNSRLQTGYPIQAATNSTMPRLSTQPRQQPPCATGPVVAVASKHLSSMPALHPLAWSNENMPEPRMSVQVGLSCEDNTAWQSCASRLWKHRAQHAYAYFRICVCVFV